MTSLFVVFDPRFGIGIKLLVPFQTVSVYQYRLEVTVDYVQRAFAKEVDILLVGFT